MSGNNPLNELLPGQGTVTCSNCRYAIPNTLHRAALAIACPACNNYFILEKGLGYKNRHTFTDAVAPVPDIPLNSRGRINGVLYEVVGFAQKRQVGTTYDWREYTLYNPAHGFACLSEFNGHWNFIRPINDYTRALERKKPDLVQYKNKEYQLYNLYHATVKFAAGEFPYDIFSDKHKEIGEWIAPPFILLRESSDDEELWFLGECFTNADMKAAFGEITLPEKSGVGATQLIRVGIGFKLLLTSTLLFIGLLVLAGFLFGFTADNQNVFRKTYFSSDANKEGVIVTPPFELTGGTSALQLDVYATISNDWFDVGIELINDVSGERFEVGKSLEFYSGYDDGGPWSEGSNADYVIMSSVPDGRYHLNLYPQWNPNVSSVGKSFEIKVFRDVSLWANFWVLLLVTLIVPLIQFFRLRSFESRRWMESDFTPKSNSILHDI